MKNVLMIAVASLVFIMASTPVSATVNGEIIMKDGFRVMRVWGTHEEMGYAHGYLLGDEIIQLFHDYFLWIIQPATYENMVKPLFRQWITIPEQFQDEFDGMLAGMSVAGCNLYSALLNRNLTSEDMAIVNSIVDYSQFADGGLAGHFGCSTIGGWGDGTLQDTAIPGGTLHCRNLDWSDTSDKLLGKRSLIIAYQPSAPAEQDWYAITFPGFIACLSGMNVQGVGATLNMGNHSVTPSGSGGITPICLQIREALELIDPNADGKHDAEDVWYVIDTNRRIPSTIIHAFGGFTGSPVLDPPSLVIESNHTGIARRLPQDDPLLSPNFLAATNHHRVLYTPVACTRYSTIQDRITEDNLIDTQEAWSIAADVRLNWTVQTMLFRPDLKDVFVASTADATPAPMKTPVHFTWDDVFTNPGDPTPTPTSTPTPQPPTPTPPPSHDALVELDLSGTLFAAGDSFVLTYRVTNQLPTDVLTGNFWLLLDVYGSYWFYPDWSQSPQCEIFSMYPGQYAFETALDFIWPDGVDGHADGLMFHGAYTDAGNSILVSNLDTVQFGY